MEPGPVEDSAVAPSTTVTCKEILPQKKSVHPRQF